MHEVGTRAWLRPADAEDEGVLFEVFSSTWQRAVAAMPNPALTQHFLRIQYTAQERRFATRYPELERFVVMVGDQPAGRMFLYRSTTSIHLVDLTLLPTFHDRGLGAALVRELMDDAVAQQMSITIRLERTDSAAQERYRRAGFVPVGADHVDVYLEWTPPAPSR